MLENLGKNIKIQDLVLPEAAKPIPEFFDPASVISKEEIKTRVENLNNSKSNESLVGTFLSVSETLALIDPIAISKVSPDIDSIREYLSQYNERKWMPLGSEVRKIWYVRGLASVKLAFPQLFKDLNVSNSDYNWIDAMGSSVTSLDLEYIRCLKILSPSRFSKIEFSSGSLETAQDLITRNIDDSYPGREGGQSLEYETEQAAYVRIVSPDAFKALGIQGERLEKLKANFLDKDLFEEPDYFTWAANMRIVLAEEINITDSRFEIIMKKEEKKEIAQNIPQIPEGRKF